MLTRATAPLFAVLAVVHTWPMLPRAGRAAVDQVDGLLNAWLLAAATRSIAEHPFTFFDINSYHPFRLALATLDHQLGALPLAGPIYLATGNALLAVNLYTIATFALAGIFMARLVREITVSAAAGIVAGSVFAFSAARLENLTHPHVLGSFWLPLILLELRRYIQLPSWRRLLRLVASALVCALTAWYYAVIAPLALLVAGAVELSRATERRRALWRAAAGGTVAAAILAAVALPYVRVGREFRPHIRAASDVAGGVADPPEISRRLSPSVIQDLSASLENFVAVGNGNQMPWLRRLRGLGLSGAAFFPGVAGATLAAVALLALLRDRARASRLDAVPLVLVALLVLAALPATRAVPGLAALVALPGFLVILIASAAICVLRRRAVDSEGWKIDAGIYVMVAIVGGAMALGPTVVGAGTEVARGIYPAEVSPFNLLRASARFGILWVVAAAALAGFGYALAARRAPARLRPLLAAGVILLVNVEHFIAPVRLQRVGRAPEVYRVLAGLSPGPVIEFPIHENLWSLYWSLSNHHPLINGYGLLQPPAYGRLEADDDLSPEMIEALRSSFHARYVVVHVAAYKDEAAARLAGNLGRSEASLRSIASAEGRRLYEIVGSSRGAPVTREYRPWMLAGRQHVSLTASVGDVPGRALGRLEVWGNGVRLNAVPAASGQPRDVTARLPRDTGDGLHLEVLADYELAAAGAPVGTTGVSAPADIHVSATPRGGRVQINGHAWVGRKGYNVAVIAPDGKVREVRAFNTSWFEAESHALVKYISDVPKGWTVAAVSTYDASRALTADAVAALQTLGMTTDLRGRFQFAHAAIGVKGAAPGTALERSGPTEASVTVGAPALLNVVLDRIRIE